MAGVLDYEKVISYYVQQEGYAEALDILARQVWNLLGHLQ